MKIIVAKTAGFCFGVNRAVNSVEKLLSDGKKTATLGPLIHNPQYIDSLKKRGVITADDVNSVPNGYELVIRAHGITKEMREKLKIKNIPYVDATCPFVKKIASVVEKNTGEGKTLLIAGNENHPEVQGFRSYSKSKSFVFSNLDELKKIFEENPNLKKDETVIVSQTTFNVEEFKKCVDFLKKVCTNAKIFDTICGATSDRQEEARRLSHICDILLVIGGKMSSNTQKLKAVCEKNTETYLIESAEELQKIDFSHADTVGITAGASTPVYIIKEVIKTMSENEENKVESVEAEGQAVVDSEEKSFAQALEESLQNMNSDPKVVGTVVGVSPTEIQVDIGRKQQGFVPKDEYSADPSANIEDEVKIGDKLKLIIMKTNDVEGTIMCSKKRYDAQANWDKIAAAKDSGEVLEGKVSEILNTGVIVYDNSVRIFIPASQATLSRSDKLEDLLGKDVKFNIIDVDSKRRRVVGSIRNVAREERKAAKEKFWAEVEVGQKYTGKVVSVTDFGAFVEVAPGVQGLCHKTELSWDRVKNPSDVVSVGDEISVAIKGIDRDARKLSLTHKDPNDSPWEILRRDYPVGTVCEVEIVSLTTFGAFAQVIPHIQGLIHISQIANHRVEKPQDELQIGQKVKAVITNIDFEKKRVSLSIRALLDDEPEAVQEEPEEEEDDLEGKPVSLDDLMAQYGNKDSE